MAHELALSAVELCAGVGMLGEGFRAACEFLGVVHRTVAYVEREAPAAAQLVALMEAGCLDAAPVWSDLLTFDGDPWRGKVDCIVAGFPCQDISIAGKRAGLDGQRSGLFFDILDLADHCGAWLLALENVSAIATATASVVDEEEGELDERAAARVVGELADRGWNAEWITLSASDVGASHGRARWFALAWRRELADAARHGGDGSLRQAGSGRGVCEAGEPVAHPERPQRWALSAAGAGGQQRHDTGRGKAHGGAGIAVEALGDTENAIGRRELEPCGARSRGTGLAGDGAELAVAESNGRNEGRAESSREQGRPDAAECGRAMADTSSTGHEGREQRRACIGDGGGAGSTWTS